MIFDTDVIIWALRGNSKAAHAINGAPHRALSIISLMELLQGARSKREAGLIKGSLRQLGFIILPLSEAIGASAAALVEEHALTHGMQLADALIAATALDGSYPICTANTKHFRPIRNLARAAFRP